MVLCDKDVKNVLFFLFFYFKNAFLMSLNKTSLFLFVKYYDTIPAITTCRQKKPFLWFLN